MADKVFLVSEDNGSRMNAALASGGRQLAVSISESDGSMIDQTGRKLGGAASALTPQDVAAAPSQRLAKLVIAHRGGGAIVHPENSMSAYKASAAAGLMHIEQDCHLLTDGSLACMHDATVDRTTSGTGNTTSFNADTFKALSLDPKTYLGPAYPAENCVLFSDVLRELASSGCVFWPEAKSTNSGAVIVSTLLRHNIPKYRAVVQAGDVAELAAAVSAGYGASMNVVAETADFAALKAAGVSYVASGAWTFAQAAAAHAQGLTTILFTPTRRVTFDNARAVGVDMVFSDDPLWTGRLATPQLRDPFYDQAWTPGMIPATTTRGGFVGPGKFQISAPSGTYNGTLQGWACPIKGNEKADSFVINLKITIDVLVGGDTSRWAGIFIGSQTDEVFADVGTLGVVNGYQILMRGTGNVQVYKITAGAAAVTIAAQQGSAIAVGTAYDMTITVTPQNIRVQVPALGVTFFANDTQYRGGYLHFGSNGATVSYGPVVIS